MKRMVKNGNLIDVEPDGSITVAGKPIGGGGGGDRCLVVTGEFMKEEGEYIYNTFTLSEEDREKILNNEIDVISGTFKESADDETPTSFTVVRESIVEYESQKYGNFLGANIEGYTTNKMKVYGYQLAINPGLNIILGYIKEVFLSPAELPADFNSKTYTFKSVNGVPTWVEG